MTLLEREEELARLAARLDPPEGRAVLIEGEAGIGKSSLLAETVARARAAGLTVLSARGTELELDLAFGAVRQLLGPTAARRPEVLAGPAQLAAPALGMPGPPAGPAADPLYALYWAVANLAETGPLVLAVDDLQWLDPESARFLAYLSARLEGLPVLLLATARPDSLVRFEGAEVIAPAPLSARAAVELADDPDAHRLTGGNPFLLTHYAQGATVADWATRRAEAISADAAGLAAAVSLFPGGARLAEAARVAEQGTATAARAADALVGAGMLEEREGRLEFAHPLIRSGLYERQGAFARRRGHAVAAAALREQGAPAEQIAAHLLAGEPAGDPEHVRILRRAADAAIAAVAPRAAVRYLDRALQEGAAGDEERRHLLVELGRWQRLTGDERAQQTLSRAVEAAHGTPLYPGAAIELAATAFVNGDRGAVEQTVSAALGADLPAEPRLVLELVLAESLWAHEDYGRSVELIDHVSSDLPGDTPAERMALGMAAPVRLMRGHPTDEVLDMLRRSIGPDGRAAGPVAGIDVGDPLQWMLICEALDEAQALGEERMRHARETGDEALYAGTQNALGWLLDLRGDLRGAEATFRLGLAQPAVPQFMRWHIAMNLAGTFVRQGELDEVLAVMDAQAEAGPSGAETTPAVRRAQVHLRRGGHAAALPALERLHRDILAVSPHAHPNLFPMFEDYADALSGMGRRDEAVAEAQRLTELSVRAGAVLGEGMHRTTLGRLTEDEAELARAVELLAGSPYRWYEARARLDLGTLLRRTRRRVDAREHLRRALDYGERNGARLIAERAREELRLAGARPRSAVLTGVDALTPAEARIARLAAEGRSNKEIAQHLFVTVKTVEMNLVRAYRKLDIASRKDLPAAMG